MTYTIDAPDFRDIPTPWEPEEIVWRYTTPMFDRDKDSLAAAVADQSRTHVVREVQLQIGQSSKLHSPEIYDPYPRISIDEAMAGLALVDEQFRQLEELTDISVAQRQWHVFNDKLGRTRTLARVQIIDGVRPKRSIFFDQMISPNQTLQEALRIYAAKHSGVPLQDLNRVGQYVFGRPRAEGRSSVGNQALYLVDIEPLLNFEHASAPLRSLPEHLRGERIT